jgi:hypothetical protein
MTGTYTLIEANRQHAQNIAAIAAEFHTHRLYNDFYDTFGKLIDGFVGNYDLCIQMAEALTDWELEHGGLMAYENAGVAWIEVVENFVEDMLERSIETQSVLNPHTVLREIQVLQIARERA